MKIDNRITIHRLKNVIIYNFWMYLLLIVAFVFIFSAVEFYVNKPTDDEILSIWMDDYLGLDDSTEQKIKEIGTNYGIKEYHFHNHDSLETEYSTYFATIGIYNTDIYILLKDEDDEKKDTIESYEDSGVFMDLSVLGLNLEGSEYYEHNGTKIGVKYGKYYIFVRNGGSITNDLAKEVIELLINESNSKLK